MANTTNYNWETPDDTDLVKDGAAAIRTLGSAIDSTVYTNANAAISKTIVDAKGDIIAATAADTVARLGVGTNGQVLTADSTTSTGLKWATAGAAEGPAFRATKSGNTGITNGTWTKVTFDTETFDTDSCFASSTFTPNKAGYYQVNGALNSISTNLSSGRYLRLYKNGSNYSWLSLLNGSTNSSDTEWISGGSDIVYLNGTTDYIELYAFINSATATIGANTTFSAHWIRG